MIRVRDVPDDIHARLRAGAAATPLPSIPVETAAAEQPMMAEVIARAAACGGGASEAIVAAVRRRDGTTSVIIATSAIVDPRRAGAAIERLLADGGPRTNPRSREALRRLSHT
jgi:hypothetical protein